VKTRLRELKTVVKSGVKSGGRVGSNLKLHGANAPKGQLPIDSWQMKRNAGAFGVLADR